MAKTKVPGGYIDDGSITSSHLHSSHGITTNDIGEHTNNKYYTDARVDARLAASKSTAFITTGNIEIDSDSGKLRLGAGADLRIYHSGFDSYIDNHTGHLVLRNLANDKDIVLQTDDGSGGTADYMRLIGASDRILFSKSIRLADTKGVQLGDGSDFQASFNGSNTFIANNTGILYLTQNVDDGVIHIRNDDGSGGVANYITLHGSTGEVRLTHYGNVKLATKSDGIDVTGHIDATTLTTTGNVAVGGNLTVTGTTTTVNTVTMNAQNAVVFEGATADAHETTLTIIDPTADRTINLPNQSGTIPVLAAASNTAITATPAELNYVDGVTSNIQTQLNAKQATISSSTDLTLSSVVGTSTNENRLGALFVGADSDIYLYESATNAFTIRTGASGAYKYFTFLADGKLNLANDGLQIGGTEVISGGRNLSNIGTISSGAITTSGLLTVGSGAGAIKINESFVTARSSDNANDINLIANINVFDADDVVIGSTSGQRYNDNIVFRTNGSQALRLDSSQNATFAGTISSGAITSTGTITAGANSGVIKEIGSDLSLVQGAIGLRINDAASAISPTTASLNNDAAVDLGVSNVRFRNLYLSGTIRSGNIGIGTDTSSFWGQANSLVLDDSGNTGLTIKSAANGNGRVVFTDQSSSNPGLNDGGQIHYQHTNDEMNLRTAGTDAITISSSQHTTFAGNIIGNDVKAAGSGGLSLQTDEGTKRIEILDSGVVRFNTAYTFPTSDGTNGQALVTDGSGGLSFATVSSGSGFSTITEPAAGQLKIGAQSGANEGGEILLENAAANGGGGYTTDIHLDNYQNQFRIHSGGSVDLSVDTSGNMTVPGDISLPYGSINDSGTDLVIHGTNAVVLKTDGGTGLTFPNNSVHATFGGNITFAEYLYHSGDTDTNLRFQTDRATLTSGGGAIVDAHSNGNLYLTGSTVQVYGNIAFNGSITGNGSALTTLNASNLSSGTVAEARLPATARRDQTGSTANYGPWYSTGTYVYDATNGTRYYWLLIGTIAASSSRGMIEYEVKDDENYPMGLRGTLFFSGFNSGTSFSVQHDVTTAYAVGHEPQVRLDTSRRIWMRFPNNDWASYFRFRVHKQGAFTTNTSWSTGTTRYDTAGSPSSPPNASSDILPGQNLRATSSSVTGTVPSYAHAFTSDRIKARKGFFGEKIAVGPSQTDVHGTYHLYNNGTSYLNGAVTIDDNLTITNGAITGSGSGITNLNASNLSSGTLSNDRLNVPSSGDWWSGGTPVVRTDGVMEIGKYIDFHNTDTATSDYDVRLQVHSTNNLSIASNGRILTTGDEGSGNGLDADTVDGVEASSFLRSDTADTATGNITLGASTKLIFGNNTAYGIGAGGHNYRSGYFDTLESGSSSDPLELVYYQGNKVNIGTGGGNKPLSAGSFEIAGTSVINSSRGLTNITSANVAGNITIDYTGQGTNDAGLYVANDNSDWGIYVNKDGTATYGIKIAADGGYPFQITNSSGTEKFRVDADGDVILAGTVDGRDVAADGTKLDGIAAGATNVTNNNQLTNGAGYITSSGTAANATQAGGLSVHTGRNNEANKIVRTDANGYIQAGWINTTSGSQSSAMDRIYASYDGYIRYYTPANFLNGGGMGEKIFNNQGRNHSTYTNFNTDMPAGVHYLQQGNNGPTGTSSHQFYGFKFGLGNEYGTTGSGGSDYSAQMYFPRAAQGGGNGLYFRDKEGGSFGSWRQVDAGTLGTLSLKSASGQTGADQVLRSASNGYFYHNQWIDIGASGIYSTAANGAHLRPNQTTSYATWATSGSRGGYDGILFDHGGDMAIMFDGSANGGFYRQASSRWVMYHHLGNNSTGFGSSTTSSSYQIYVNGAIYASGDIVGSSDERLKTEIKTIPNALDKVLKLRGVTYKWKDTTEGGTCVNNITETRMGVIAQEVVDILPEVVTHDKENDRYGVSYGHLTGVLIEAVKELKQEINELKKELEEVKNG